MRDDVIYAVSKPETTNLLNESWVSICFGLSHTKPKSDYLRSKSKLRSGHIRAVPKKDEFRPGHLSKFGITGSGD